MIVNLHGIGGKAHNTNWTILQSIFGESKIYSPQLNYKNNNIVSVFNQVYEYINSYLEEDTLDFIVGNSFGGFLATRLSYEFNVPYILMNPCLRPDISLQSILPGYMSNYANDLVVHSWIKWWQDNKNIFDNAYIIFGDNDEVLDSSLARSIANRADIITISGGHKLSGEEFEQEFKVMVDKILSQKGK